MRGTNTCYSNKLIGEKQYYYLYFFFSNLSHVYIVCLTFALLIVIFRIVFYTDLAVSILIFHFLIFMMFSIYSTVQELSTLTFFLWTDCFCGGLL